MKGKASDTPTSPSVSQSIFPNFCSNRVALLVILIGELLAFVLALNSTSDFEAFWSKLGLTTLFVQWVAITAMIGLCLCNRWLNQANSSKTGLTVYSLVQGITLICSALALWGFDVFLGSSATWVYELDVTEKQGYFLFRNFAISSIITLVALRYFYIQQQWRKNVETEAYLRLQALQARIRPHFLFNSMNTIASLIRSHPEQAEEAVLDLADLFRSTLEQAETTTLDEELKTARRYLHIESLRLGERLCVDWQVEENMPLNMPIPALILQPLLENAVYHGIQPRTEGGCIIIRITASEDELMFTITNPLSSSLKTYKQQAGNHMAQDNVRQRLALAYGQQSRMTFHRSEDHYVVSFAIPRQPAR